VKLGIHRLNLRLGLYREAAIEEFELLRENDFKQKVDTSLLNQRA